MRKLDILCDLDGIVADLHGPWLAWYNEKFNDTLTKGSIHTYYMADVVKLEAQKHIHDFLNLPDAYANLPPHPGACEALQLFHEQGHHVAIASMPVQRPASTTEKLIWCRQHLPWLTKRDIYIGGDKSRIMADVFIDDDPSNLAAFHARQPRSRLVTISWPYNQKALADCRAEGYHDTAGAWRHIIDYVTELAT